MSHTLIEERLARVEAAMAILIRRSLTGALTVAERQVLKGIENELSSFSSDTPNFVRAGGSVSTS